MSSYAQNTWRHSVPREKQRPGHPVEVFLNEPRRRLNPPQARAPFAPDRAIVSHARAEGGGAVCLVATLHTVDPWRATCPFCQTMARECREANQ